MIELLILFELNKKVLTMYGISKEIKSNFSVMTTPSIGTIKPALDRLGKNGYIKSQKTMSSGGRPSTYYSITKDGLEELKKLLLEEPLENPIQFLTTSRAKLMCADVLNNTQQKELFNILKIKTESLVFETKNLLTAKDNDVFAKMVYDNLICEYKNFISLLEGFERASKN